MVKLSESRLAVHYGKIEQKRLRRPVERAGCWGLAREFSAAENPLPLRGILVRDRSPLRSDGSGAFAPIRQPRALRTAGSQIRAGDPVEVSA